MGGNMKITHLCLACFFPDGYSYQENLLPKYHRLMGYDVDVIASLVTFDKTGKITQMEKVLPYVNENDCLVTRLDYKKPSLVYKKMKRFKGLYEALNKSNPDILFIHGCQFLDIDVVIKFIKRHNVQVYVDNHADFSNSAKNWVSRRLLHGIVWKRCAKRIEPLVAKFYGVLPARVDFLKNVYGVSAEKCELLVMGADDALVYATSQKEELEKKYNICKDDFLIVTGGKIDAFKTQTLLLMKAVSEITNPNVKLLIFGSVTNDLKEHFNQLLVADKVMYAGWIDSRESYAYFSMADLVVFPGRHSVFWEQVVAQGIPMIVKRWQGTSHVDIGGNIIYLDKDSKDEIKEKLEFLINDLTAYSKLDRVAKSSKRNQFLYSEIAKKAIEKN